MGVSQPDLFDRAVSPQLLPPGCNSTSMSCEGRPTTPVIGVCTKSDDDLKGRCLIAGMDQLLVKPLVMSELVAVLRGLKSVRSNETSSDSSRTGTTAVTEIEKGIYKQIDPPKHSKHRNSNELMHQSAAAVPDAPVILTMKVLVGIGQVGMVSVGGGLQMPSGKPRWEYFMVDLPVPPDIEAPLSRKPLEQLRICEEYATPGSVILSPEVCALCQKDCKWELLADGFARLVYVKTHSYEIPPPRTRFDVSRVPPATVILKRYLPDMLRSKFEAVSAKDGGAAGARPEVRHVTCLFLCFPGLSNMRGNNSDLLNNVQKIMVAVQRSLRTFDGLLVQFKMDEKGYVMLCAFGLPGNLHEDDPKRGIQTALEVHQNITALGQTTDIGVTTGKLLCTVIGGEKRREYTAFGNCINLSARLMKKANNEVLIDLETYNSTSGEFVAEPLPPMKVKGRTGLIHVYRVVKYNAAAGSVSPVRRLSDEVGFTSARASIQVELTADIFGRKTELDLAISKIEAFITRSSTIEAHKVKRGKSELSNICEVQLKDAENNESNLTNEESVNVTDSSSEITPSLEEISLLAEDVTCSAIVIIGQAGIGKTRLMKAIGMRLLKHRVEIIGVGSVNSNMLVYGVWGKLLLDLLPFEPISSPEERGLVVLKYLDPDLHEHAHLLKDVMKVQFKDASLEKNVQKEPKRSHMLRRTFSERRAPKETGRRVSFMAKVAAQGALIIGGKSSQPEQSVLESLSQTRPALEGGSGSEMDPMHSTDAEDERTQVTSLSGSSKSLSTESATSISDTENFAYSAAQRLLVDSAVLMSRRDSEVLSPDTRTQSPSNSPGDDNIELDLRAARRRSSTDSHLNKTTSPEVKIQRLGKLLLSLLLAAANKPLVIFLEDAHHMDYPSWSVLRELSEQKNSGILVIAACRFWGVHAPKDFTALVGAQSTLQLHLRELDAESTEALIKHRISSALNAEVDIPRHVLQAVSRRTQGHPLFIEQMAMALVEQKLKALSNSQEERKKALQTLNLDNFNFSHSMEALITSRVDLLEPNQGLALKVASVIGLSFSPGFLLSILNRQLQREEVACLNKEQLEVALQGLEKLNFIFQSVLDAGCNYSFANSVTKDATYEMLPIKQRRTIHAEIAQELLKLGTSGARCVTIAQHYTMACKDVEELEVDLAAIAIDHWQEAASSAMFKFGQYKLAIEYYQNAIHLEKLARADIHPQRIARWHFYLAKAYGALGDMDSSLENTIKSLDYAGENSSDFTMQQQTSASCSASLLARISSWRSECQSGILSWLATITGNTGNEQVLFFRCEALAHLSQLAIVKEDVTSSRKIIKRYLAVANEVSRIQPLELARAYSMSAIVSMSAIKARYKARKSYEFLQLHAGSIRPAVQAGDIHFNLAKLCQFQGKWLKAERHASSAQRMYEASQTRRELDVCRCIIGLGQLYQGQLETAREMGMRVLEYRHEHPQLLYWSTYLVIACLNTMRRFKDSSDVFARIKNYPCPLLTLTLQAKALGWLSAMHLGEAEATIKDAVALVPRLLEIVPLTPAFPLAYASAAEVLLMSLENNQVLEVERTVKERLVECLVNFFKTSSARIEICGPFYMYYQARLVLFRGNNQMALSGFEGAEKEALRLKMLPLASFARDGCESCIFRSNQRP
ncbi:hypothetical protein MPTK1_3g24330 [Marchantia polymorpha subsp. ruderalis]|uniref:Guanylate cyclase domain-containing protein n=2 Tax=Marchantia polymorpha TaxID=3197 RepID=A0AAF6B4A9_MARPO|nr:hypothetical protein MARPO_0178s0022 [Marchantia polymorpha]BBN06842.1 hypothetical protein Mp_3g24330 [Marchantia polymorpha subsp. ruderalis]PTQ27975.1 hypothetical protein MARPO_0178s0022 [Marchantia polymorpha]PTQ27977.1 hypothetical protein MARPO_0178s0022 [Marchantia polymorpha]BBN06843.1 hypothetical protein Mp_3g24330 [Marchantia polymorpha subsp. ruderalis]|eukprot:PTQ27973.1 hypothetical protein MARPO_0178s0022 [Marchantia polymorpha]